MIYKKARIADSQDGEAVENAVFVSAHVHQCNISGALRHIEIISFSLPGPHRPNVEQKVITSAFPRVQCHNSPRIHNPKLHPQLPELPAICSCSSSLVASNEIQIRKTGSSFVHAPSMLFILHVFFLLVHTCMQLYLWTVQLPTDPLMGGPASLNCSFWSWWLLTPVQKTVQRCLSSLNYSVIRSQSQPCNLHHCQCWKTVKEAFWLLAK